MYRKVAILALTGTALACGRSQSVDTVSSQSALSLSSFGYTGSNVRHVSSFQSFYFGSSVNLYTDMALDDQLGPVAGLGPNGPSILGSSIGGVSTAGEVLAGSDLVGQELVATSVNEGDTRLRIADIRRGEDDNDDILYYDVRARVSGGAEAPLCGVNVEGNPVLALALPGAWNLRTGQPGDGGWLDESDSFFFACRGSSVAKCFEMGFKPWRFGGHNKRVISHQEACVRALRADYCGDGSSFTEPGVEVSVWTEVGSSPMGDDHALEAAWDADGARCVRTPRISWSNRDTPSCVKKLKKNCREKAHPHNVMYTAFGSEADAPGVSLESAAVESTEPKKAKKNKKKK